MNKALEKFLEDIQVGLASMGVITTDEPTEFGVQFRRFMETKLRKMEKQPSNSARIRYIQRQVSEMDGEDNLDRMQQRWRMVKYLCQGICERHPMELTEEQKDQIQKAEEDAQKKYLDLASKR